MPRPILLLQIVSATHGTVARIPAGGALEADLIELITKHVLAKGVSFKTKKHVEKDIRQGVQEAIFAIKEQTRFLH